VRVSARARSKHEFWYGGESSVASSGKWLENVLGLVLSGWSRGCLLSRTRFLACHVAKHEILNIHRHLFPLGYTQSQNERINKHNQINLQSLLNRNGPRSPPEREARDERLRAQKIGEYCCEFCYAKGLKYNGAKDHTKTST